MLLNIHNLPYTVTYNNIKSLIYSKCGIAQVILDNLVPHENRTKKVTVGLSGEEDAAIFMKNIDGTLYKGHQLRVVTNTKIPKLSQPGASDTIQPLMSQASTYPQGQNFTAPPIPNAPTMVPPPMNFGTPNPFYPNQSAYYMMNQPTYTSTSSLPNVGYQTVPYGNVGNHGYVQNAWSDNTWNQQQQSEGSQKPQPQKERVVNWDKGGSKSGNNNSNWDNSQSQWDSSQPQWDSSQSQWDNSQSQWDRSQSQWGSSQSQWVNSNTKRDNSNTKRDNSNTKRDNSNTKWDSSNAKWDNNNSKWEASNSQRGNHSQWDNNPAPERDNRRESRWNNSSGDSNWNSHNDPRTNTSRDSNWQNSRDSNRDNSYRSNQRAGTSRGRGSPNRSHNRNHSSGPSGNIYGDHVRNLSQDKSPRDSEPQQNWFRSPPRQRSPKDRGQALKRDRYPMSHNAPSGSSARNSGFDPRSKRAIQLGRLWRGQFIATKARNILEDPRFEYDCPKPGKLFNTLKSHIKSRVKINFDDDYSMRMSLLAKKYNKIYGFHGDWVVLRDSLQKLGGRLFSKVDAEGGEKNHPCKTIKRNKKARKQQEGEGDLRQEESQYGGQAQYGEQSLTVAIGNVELEPSQQRVVQLGGPSQQQRVQLGGPSQQQGVQLGVPAQLRGPQPGGSQSRSNETQGQARKQVNNPMGIPLALIPGRIPQYPKGDKKLNTQHKQNFKEILTSDLSSPMFNGLKPALRNAIDEEVDLMCTVIDKVCADTEKDAILPDFCQVLKGEVSEELRRVLKVMLARRIIPILPMMLRVFASPPIKRAALEDFLKSFNVSALKKSKQNTYYIVHCNSVQDNDNLCKLKDVLIEQSRVSFKPLHLVNPKKMPKKNKRPVFKLPVENATKNAAENEAQNTEKEDIIIDVPEYEGVDDHNDDYEVEENWVDDNMDTFPAEAGEEQDLCQQMKNIYDQINNGEPNDIEEYQANDNEELNGAVGQSNEEAFQAFQSVQVAESEDFTTDHDLENIMKHFSEVAYNKNSGQNESVDESKVNKTVDNQPEAENIEMVDVNEEDLEDW